jgi:hypothetical protein
MTASNQAIPEFLLGRRSSPLLGAPGPTPEEVALMVRAALRAPDFQRLRPYRFIVACAAGQQSLGAAMQRASAKANRPAAFTRRSLTMSARAPMVVVAVASPKPSELVPDEDRGFEVCE